jgi:hypothetical protein
MDDPNGCMRGMTNIDFPDQATMLRTTLGFWVGNSRRNGEVLAWVPHVIGPLSLTKYQGYVVRDNNGGSQFIITDLWTATGSHVPTRRVVDLFSAPCPLATASTGPDVVQPIPNLGSNPPLQGGVQKQPPLQCGVNQNKTADTLTGDFWIAVPGQPDQEVTVKISILSDYPPPGVSVAVGMMPGNQARQMSSLKVMHYPNTTTINISEVYMPRVGRWLPCIRGCEQTLSKAPGN